MRPAPLVVLILALAGSAQAVPRAPQVPVSGNALSSFFASQGQTIAVVGDQQDVPELALANVGIPGGSYVLFIHSVLGSPSLDAYNAADPASPLFLVFPGAATPGWFTAVSMMFGPERLVVQTFDGNGVFVGSQSYLGANGFQLGLAVGGSSGVKYSQDARNPGGLARLLFYAGTGAHTWDTWLCAEDQDGGTGDFADAIFLIQGMSFVPVQRTTWGTLKRRFR